MATNAGQMKKPPTLSSGQKDLDKLKLADDWTEKAEKKVGAGEMPWRAANDRIQVPFLVRLPESVHMKLQYVTGNLVRDSIHAFILKATERELNRLLENSKDD